MYVCEVTFVYDDVTCVYRGYQQIANGLCEACNPGDGRHRRARPCAAAAAWP